MGHLNSRIPAQATLYRLVILAHGVGVSNKIPVGQGRVPLAVQTDAHLKPSSSIETVIATAIFITLTVNSPLIF